MQRWPHGEETETRRETKAISDPVRLSMRAVMLHAQSVRLLQTLWICSGCVCLSAIWQHPCWHGLDLQGTCATWLQVLYQNPLAEEAPADAVTGLAVTGQERRADGASRRKNTLVECWLVMELCNMGTLQVGTTGHQNCLRIKFLPMLLGPV